MPSLVQEILPRPAQHVEMMSGEQEIGGRGGIFPHFRSSTHGAIPLC